MIKGLSEYEKYKVIRPIFGDCDYDIYHMPIIKKVGQDTINWEQLRPVGIQNASSRVTGNNSLLLMFNYDKKLLSLWNAPLKRIALFQTFEAISTPDFSLYPNMNVNEIQHNVYMSRWLGATWQQYGCKIVPTVGWADNSTYDICFSGIEKGSAVVISTLGCQERKSMFLQGFLEMKQRIEPALIVVYGDMISGMTGRFINFKYKDAFCSKNEQMRMKEVPQVFTIEEVA